MIETMLFIIILTVCALLVLHKNALMVWLKVKITIIYGNIFYTLSYCGYF